jgi:hypothetical protein
MGRREPYRRLSRISEALIQAADRVGYATLNEGWAAPGATTHGGGSGSWRADPGCGMVPPLPSSRLYTGDV